MALTSEQIDMLADKYIVDLYSNLEREVIGDISRRLRKAERFTETAELQAKFMTEQGFSAVEIRNRVMKDLAADPEYQKFLAENTKEYKMMVKHEIAETVKEAQKNGNKLVAEAGTMAWNDDLQMWAEHGVDLSKPSSLSQIMTAFRRQTVNELKNLTKTSGFKNTVLGTTGVMNAFQFGGKDESSQDLIQGLTLAGVFLDEVALMPESFVNQATGRCSVTDSKMWFNCNPEGPDHYFKREWIDKADEKRLKHLHFTMNDNPSLSKQVRERYERMYSGVFYDRFISGLWVLASGIIFRYFADDPEPYLINRGRGGLDS